MRILAIETTSLRGSVAVFEGSECLAYASHTEKNQHAELLIGLIDNALKDAQTTAQDLDIIGVGVGPGTFTGIRVGLALTAGFLLATRAIGIGVPSLASISQNASPKDPRPRLVILDARRDEYFVALYDCNGLEILAPLTVSRANVVEHLNLAFRGVTQSLAQGCLVLGDLNEELRHQLKEQLDCLVEGVDKEQGLPDARACALLAQKLDPKAYPPEPLYLRGANAKRPDLPISPLLLPRS